MTLIVLHLYLFYHQKFNMKNYTPQTARAYPDKYSDQNINHRSVQKIRSNSIQSNGKIVQSFYGSPILIDQNKSFAQPKVTFVTNTPFQLGPSFPPHEPRSQVGQPVKPYFGRSSNKVGNAHDKSYNNFIYQQKTSPVVDPAKIATQKQLNQLEEYKKRCDKLQKQNKKLNEQVSKLKQVNKGLVDSQVDSQGCKPVSSSHSVTQNLKFQKQNIKNQDIKILDSQSQNDRTIQQLQSQIKSLKKQKKILVQQLYLLKQTGANKDVYKEIKHKYAQTIKNMEQKIKKLQDQGTPNKPPKAYIQALNSLELKIKELQQRQLNPNNAYTQNYMHLFGYQKKLIEIYEKKLNLNRFEPTQQQKEIKNQISRYAKYINA